MSNFDPSFMLRRTNPTAYYWPDQKFQNLTYCLDKITVDGDVFEFGVANGASLRHIAQRVPNRTVFGFDSFMGLPEPFGPLPVGTFSTNRMLPTVSANVKLVVGLFQETLPVFEKRPAAFIHIDCDLYTSTKFVLDALKEVIVPGTVIVFDEFCVEGLDVKMECHAFQEFIEQTKKDFEVLSVIPNMLSTTAVVIK
jgi:predicted O-methyltransferase YrrM